MKLQARLAECEGTVENLNSKLMQLEKSKAQIQVLSPPNSIHFRWIRTGNEPD